MNDSPDKLYLMFLPEGTDTPEVVVRRSVIDCDGEYDEDAICNAIDSYISSDMFDKDKFIAKELEKEDPYYIGSPPYNLLAIIEPEQIIKNAGYWDQYVELKLRELIIDVKVNIMYGMEVPVADDAIWCKYLNLNIQLVDPEHIEPADDVERIFID